MNLILIIFFLFLALFPFGQLTRLSLGPEVNLYLADILVGFLIVSWLAWRLWKRKRIRFPPLAKPIFLFGSIAALSLFLKTPLLTGREVIVAGLYLVRWLAYAGLYWTVFDLQRDFKEFRWSFLKKFLIVIGLTVAVFGFIQYIFWPNLKTLESLGWDPHFYRLVATFLDPGFTGLILVLTLILLVTVYWGKFSWLSYSLFLIVYLALALTYSRSSYLAYLIGMAVLAWFKKAPKFFLAVFLFGLVTLMVLPRPAGEGGQLGRSYSIEARIKNWRNSLLITQDHPFLGVGFNAYRYAQRDYGFLKEDEWQVSHAGAGADASLFFVLATTGILGWLAYLWLGLKAVGEIRKGGREYKAAVGASLVALFVHSFFLNSLFYPWIMAWTWLLLAKENK